MSCSVISVALLDAADCTTAVTLAAVVTAVAHGGDGLRAVLTGDDGDFKPESAALFGLTCCAKATPRLPLRQLGDAA